MRITSSKVISTVVLLVVTALVLIVFADVTMRTSGATASYALRMAPWWIARAGGITSYLLLTSLVIVGMVLSSVPNREQFRASKILLPLHRWLALFLIAFTITHVVSIALDSYAHVGWLGAILPLAATYKTIPVAFGVLCLYALGVASFTAQFPKMLPAGRWLTIHRVALVTFVLGFVHGVLTGTDTPALHWLYEGSAALVLLAVGFRYVFVSRQRATSGERR